MSYLALDTKGDLARNYGTIAKKYYGYRVSVINLRNPIRSDGNNLMTLVNRYMDVAREHRTTLQHGRMRKSTRRSSPKPSSIRAATSRIVDKIRTSMTQQRACWQP